MASADRERQAEKALRHLTKSFYMMMSADIRIDLCGKDIFTWNECERIGEFIVVERSMYKFI